MKTAVAVLLFALLALQAVPAAPSKPWMPMATGGAWTYTVTGSDVKSLKVQVLGHEGDHYTMKWGNDSVQARLGPDGVVFLGRRAVGAAAKLTMVPVADLRWSGADHWQASTMSGCIGLNIDGTREKAETVTVPAGTYTCIKILNRTNGEDDTYWIAQGVGVVKRHYVVGNQHVEWQLATFKAGQ